MWHWLHRFLKSCDTWDTVYMWHLRHWLHCWQLRTTLLRFTLWSWSACDRDSILNSWDVFKDIFPLQGVQAGRPVWALPLGEVWFQPLVHLSHSEVWENIHHERERWSPLPGKHKKWDQPEGRPKSKQLIVQRRWGRRVKRLGGGRRGVVTHCST